MSDATRPTLREAAEYRAERLAAERRALERRKVWAARRLDVAALEHLERQLARLRSEESASTAPRGRETRAARSAYQLRHHRPGWRLPRPRPEGPSA